MKKIRNMIIAIILLMMVSTQMVHADGFYHSYDEDKRENEMIVLTYDAARIMVQEQSLTLREMQDDLRQMYRDLRAFGLSMEAMFFGTQASFERNNNVASAERATRNYIDRLRIRIRDWETQQQEAMRLPGREARQALNAFERAIDALHRHIAQYELALTLSLRYAVAVLSGAQIQADVAVQALAFAQLHFESLELAHTLGFVSRHDVMQKQHAIMQMMTQNDALFRQRDRAQREINRLLGQPLMQMTQVLFDASEGFDVIADAQTIAELTARSMVMFDAQTQVVVARENRWVYTGNQRDIRITEAERRRVRMATNETAEISRLRARITLQDDVQRAEENLTQTIRNLETAIMRQFSEQEGLIRAMTALEDEWAQAYTEYEQVMIRRGLGTASILDVEAIRFIKFQLEQEINIIQNKIWLLHFVLQHPDFY